MRTMTPGRWRARWRPLCAALPSPGCARCCTAGTPTPPRCKPCNLLLLCSTSCSFMASQTATHPFACECRQAVCTAPCVVHPNPEHRHARCACIASANPAATLHAAPVMCMPGCNIMSDALFFPLLERGVLYTGVLRTLSGSSLRRPRRAAPAEGAGRAGGDPPRSVRLRGRPALAAGAALCVCVGILRR